MKKIILIVLMTIPALLFAQTEEVKTFEQVKAEALAQFESGDFKKAIKTLSEAIEMNDKDAELYEKRGIAYRWRAKPQLAFDDLSRAIEVRPSARLYAYRSDVRKYSDISGKIEDLSQAVELEPQEFDYVYKLAMEKYEMISDYVDDHGGSPMSKAELKTTFGFENNICQLMDEAAKLNKKFESKAKHYCANVSVLVK